MESKIIVALDGMSEAESLDLADRLKGAVWGFKVNSLLISSGVSVIEKLRARGKVFADPKLHDIPNTVSNAVKEIVAAGADLVTIHASGGRSMIEAAVSASGSAKILCVTALTSLDDSTTQEVYQRSPSETVEALAALAARSNAHGIVCSPLELEMLQTTTATRQLYKVVPGIRPASYSTADDQRRIATPKSAITSGADLLVVGRPITQAEDPVRAAQDINNELTE
ncbi:MAG: orotidine-5'-phosphate decarboxylase [Bdellovibrionales bacterium]|nr:orotidine-5'-phosphate decarboxylase [Bdellovibrionales bacterium]